MPRRYTVLQATYWRTPWYRLYIAVFTILLGCSPGFCRWLRTIHHRHTSFSTLMMLYAVNAREPVFEISGTVQELHYITTNEIQSRDLHFECWQRYTDLLYVVVAALETWHIVQLCVFIKRYFPINFNLKLILSIMRLIIYWRKKEDLVENQPFTDGIWDL